MESSQEGQYNGKVFKEGFTDFRIDSFFVENIELKILSGQVYLIDHLKNTCLELPDPSYIDFVQFENLIVLSTFSKIDIYHLTEFQVEFKIDDIDGIKLNKVDSGVLLGKFNQIDSGGDCWIDFKIDLKSLELFCDHGRMWVETNVLNELRVTKYRTMNTKK